jgi:hypothetical protein
MKKAILLLFIPFCLNAGVIFVDNDNNSPTQNGSSQYPYARIQTAIDNAMNFDTIKVASGNYNRIENMGKSLYILGGYEGANSSSYNSGSGGNFSVRIANPAMTIIKGGIDSIGVNLTRFDFNPFGFLFDNFTVSNSLKGIVCDAIASWPLVDNVTISNNIIENNGIPNMTSGGGIIILGNNHRILNNIIRKNHGGRGAGISGNREDDSLLIDNNLIENNTGYDDHCGGVYLGGYVIITNNVISGNRLQNTYGWGGGVLILGTAYMSFNVMNDNYCPSYGGALFVDDGGIAYLDHELIYNNSTSLEGAAIAVDFIVDVAGSSYVSMTNCTVVNNYSTGPNGGNAVFLDVAAICDVKNCIFNGNTDDFFIGSKSSLKVNYTLSSEGFSGIGNFSADPLFADTLNEDFHLKSTVGRYDPISKTWGIDNVYSPAIDKGDPTSSYSNEPTPNGNRIDLGCYGNTSFASKSLIQTDIENSISLEPDVTVFPNPFNGNTKFSFKTENNKLVKLCIYSSNGDLIQVLLNKEMSAGIYSIDFDGMNLSSGIYFYEFQSGETSKKGKIVLMK